MNDFNRYIGLPFVDGGRDAAGLDCWGLVRLVLAERQGLDLPSYGDVSASDLIDASQAMQRAEQMRTQWQVVSSAAPQAFDVCLMRRRGARGLGHVGIMLDGVRVLHIEDATGSVCVPLSHPSVAYRILGFRRAVGMIS